MRGFAVLAYRQQFMMYYDLEAVSITLDRIVIINMRGSYNGFLIFFVSFSIINERQNCLIHRGSLHCIKGKAIYINREIKCCFWTQITPLLR